MINLFLLGREKVKGVKEIKGDKEAKEDKDNSFNVVFFVMKVEG